MRKGFALVALMAVLSPLAGCAGKSYVNAYLLDEANVGGDQTKSLKPITGVVVWPLENIAAGAKSKGVETRFSGIFADTLSLRGSFDRVVILEEDQAKDLMARAGEELGLKKKPKTPGDGALIATKLGQLTGTEAILTGRIEDYDEDKVDKSTITVVQASFNLIDAREKGYATLDSFAPIKRVWRTNVKRVSKEGPFNSRESIDEAFRLMLADVVKQMTNDLGLGADAAKKALAKKVAGMNAAAQKSLDAGEFDKAIATWNDVLKLQPEDAKAKKGIVAAEKAKTKAQEDAKAAGVQKQIEETKGRAEAAEKAGNLEGAVAEWKKILELDKGNKEAAKKVESLEKQLADQKKKAEESDKKKAEESDKKKADEKKAKEEAEKKKAAEAPAPKPEPAKESPKAEAPKEAPKAEAPKAEAPKEAPKAEAPKAEAPKEAPKAEAPKAEAPKEAPKAEAPKAEAPKAEAPKAEAPKAEAPKPAETPKAAEKKAEAGAPAAAPAGGDLEGIRNQAMAAFNKEDYATSRDLWKQILAKSPDDKQAKEMLETTEMLLNALK